MANYVDERTQKFVPLWSLIQEQQLFSNNQLTKSMHKLRELEYGVQKLSKEWDDFRKLIEFLLNLKKKLNYQTKVQQKTQFDKQINRTLMAEISSQFSLAAHKFPSDMSLWKFWVKVYEGEKWLDSLGRVYKNYTLTIGQSDPTLWIEWAVFVIRYKKEDGIQEAREIMQSCLRVHPEDPKVYVGYCRLEASYLVHIAFKKLRRSHDDTEGVIASLMEPLRLVYTESKLRVGSDPSFYMELYKVFHQYCGSPIGEFVNKILKDMETNCPTPRSITFLANLRLKASGGIEEKENIVGAFQLFERAWERNPTPALYRSYVDMIKHVLKQLEDSGAELKETRDAVSDVLRHFLERGHAKDYLTPADYITWITAAKYFEESPLQAKVDFSQKLMTQFELEKLEEADEESSKKIKLKLDTKSKRPSWTEVIDLSLEKYPTNWELVFEKVDWIIRNPKNLHVYYGKNRVIEIMGLLKNVKDPNGESFPLWQRVFRYITTRTDIKISSVLLQLVMCIPETGGNRSRIIQDSLFHLYGKIRKAEAKIFLSELKKHGPLSAEVDATDRLCEALVQKPRAVICENESEADSSSD